MEGFVIDKSKLLKRAHRRLYQLEDTFFLELIKDLKEIEGGYSNYSEDAGGETIYGITRKNHPNFSFFKIIDDFKKTKRYHDIMKSGMSRSKKFFEITRFCDAKFDQPHFDSWCEIMSIYFQFSNSEKTKDIVSSEKISDALIKNIIRPLYFFSVNAGNSRAINALINSYSNISEVIISNLISYICSHYVNICVKNPSNKIFLNGWKRRVILSFNFDSSRKEVIEHTFENAYQMLS